MTDTTPEDRMARRQELSAAIRWTFGVSAFLLAQLFLGYAAVKTAYSDGGERPIEAARLTATPDTGGVTP